MAKAVGKVILSGEHAVVYGIPAIALPILGCQATTKIVENNQRGLIIKAPQLDKTYHLDEHKIPYSPIELTVINFFKKFNLPIKNNISLEISSDIPISSGMGSGASISTSMIKALASFYNLNISKEDIFEQVFEIEKIYHGNPSGIDPKVIVYEKPFYFIKNVKMEIININAKFTIAIIDSGIRSSTKKVVEWVAEQKKLSPNKYDNIFQKINNITEKLKDELNGNDITKIGDLIKLNHYYLQEMGVSNYQLDRIVTVANESGAEG
ncbi:MAG: mevalonate kinase, partial [Candidatus Sericytochromatia bacterium]|nr:mevalonate kinase [Candidatus Sericytochromatia bacterium]